MVEAPPPRIDVYFERGYEVYLTPLGGGLANVAVLLDRSRVEALGGRLREAFKSLASSVPIGGAGFELVDEPLAVGPFPAGAKAAWRDNLVLVGDANGFFDPISGNGMTLALLAARCCASAIDAYLKTGSTERLRAYERQCRAAARNSTLFARLSLALAGRPRLGRRVIENFARKPNTFGKLVALNDGELGLSALRPRDVLASVLGI
jgi:flavin-dependent dehydrogenase